MVPHSVSGRLRPLRLVLVNLGLGLVVTLAATANVDETRHLRLERTSPPADTVLDEAPVEIRLFFSEPPQMRGTTVRITDGADALVPATDAAADDDDPRQVVVRPEAPLSLGSYTVHWRVIARDGHTQRGDFNFQVSGE